MEKTEWIRCPVCGNKTRLQLRADTELRIKKLSSLLSEVQLVGLKCTSSPNSGYWGNSLLKCKKSR